MALPEQPKHRDKKGTKGLLQRIARRSSTKNCLSGNYAKIQLPVATV